MTITAAICFSVTSLALDASSVLPRDAQDALVKGLEFRAYESAVLEEADFSLTQAMADVYDARRTALEIPGTKVMQTLEECASTYGDD